MLGKLMKYDLKSMSVAFVPMWILAPVIGLLFSFSLRGVVGSNSGIQMMGTGLLSMIMFLVFFGVMVGLTVMTVLFILQRFWNGLLKEEGYLMFTLPVEPWELIVSKALTATLITCISIFDGVLACVLLGLASIEELLRDLGWLWMRIVKEIGKAGPIFWIYVILALILVIFSIADSIYHAYAAMAIGQLFESHRIIGSCVSYVGISILYSIAGNMMRWIVSWILPDDWWRVMSNSYDMWGIVYLLMLLLSTILSIIILHVVTERIMATRLNLE